MSQNTENVAKEAKRIYEEQLRVSLEESHMNEFVANNGDHPLPGVGLLFGLKLQVNYHTLELKLNSP